MALRAVPDHPKFSRLKTLLGTSKAATMGYLELVWHFTGRFTPQGDIGKYSDDEIESWVEWDGKPGELITALVQSRWIDVSEEYRLVVHEWAQWADSWVHAELAKKTLLFATGEYPRIDHEAFSGQTRVRIRAEFDKKYGTVSRQCPDSVPTVSQGSGSSLMTIPEPEPEPEPEEVRDIPKTVGREGVGREPQGSVSVRIASILSEVPQFSAGVDPGLVQRLLSAFPTQPPEWFLSEATKAASWLHERPKEKKTMAVSYLRNWLTRAYSDRPKPINDLPIRTKAELAELTA